MATSNPDRPYATSTPSSTPRPATSGGGGDVRRIEIEPDESGFGKILKK
jgi:hypothetical protein